MKKAILFFALVLIAGALIAACVPASIPANSQNGVIRLHIMANSDDEADQETKIVVRDRVLEKWGSTLASLDSSDEAWETLNSLLPQIKQYITEVLDGRGADYGVSVKTGVYDFPERDYNGVEFPEGRYRALRIELGNASGRNWWCVMFPPLCLLGDNGEMSIEEYKDLVRELNKEGSSANLPEAPVRSWLFDKLLGSQKWDKEFLVWAKEYWLGGGD